MGIVKGYTVTHLLFFPESKETNTGDLDDLEPHTGNITLSLAGTTETGDEDLVVLIDEVKATIVLSRRSIRAPQVKHEAERHTGTKAVTFFPFLISCTRTHLRIAELGCLASTPTFSSTMPLACEDPPVGEVL